MKLILLFFLFYIHISYALNCIDGFTPINGKCLRLITTDKNRDGVRRQCNLFGGNIVSIHNSIDNTAVAQFAFPNSDPIWIGLQCSVDHSPPSCIWDDQLGNASTYSNFIAGNPAIEIGKCVYMLTTGSLRGRWLSGECEATALSTVCETDPIGQCSHSNGDGYCYYPLGDLTTDEAQQACSQNCNGNLVSIHGSTANNYVYSIFKDPSKRYLRIGLNSSNIWTDRSSYDYQNIGYSNTGLGTCYSMSLINEVVQAGKWISSNCSSQLPSICKWVPGSSCVAPTLAPSQCTSPTYLTDTGLVYSPNYPYAYTTTNVYPCYYILTTTYFQAAVWFDEFDLDPSSSIELYSSVDDDTPFAVINQTTPNVLTTIFTSPTFIIKMVFKPCTTNCDQSRNYKWKAVFGRDYERNVIPMYDINGVVSSKNDPINYPSGANLTYLIYNRPSYGVKLHFDVIDTELNRDFVKVYNGQTTSSSYLLASLSGNYSSSSANLTYTTTGDKITIIFSSSSFNSSHVGFRARFSTYP